jgi:uncharacterized membrane protein YkoI
MRKSTTKIIVLTWLLLLGSGVGYANPLLNGLRGQNLPERPKLDTHFNASPARETLTAREAVKIAERRYGGRAVGAKAIDTGRGTAYRVRILQDDGKIRNVVIDAP